MSASRSAEFAGAPAELFSVKNTFIQVDGVFEDDDFGAACTSVARRRQVSEPVLSLAQRMQNEEVWGPVKPSRQVSKQDGIEEDPCSSCTASTAEETEGDAQQQQQEHEQFTPALADDEMQWPPQQMVWVPQSMMMAMPMPHTTQESWANASEGLDAMVMVGQFGMEMEPAMETAEVKPTCNPIPEEWLEVTTIMMRNLPNRYTQPMLLEEISAAGFEGAFDFLYLPIDPETSANKGYAFMNFVSPEDAWRFRSAFEGARMSRFNSSKFVSVSPAALQGLEANYAHYSTTRCNRGDPSTRPLFLREPKHGRVGLRQRASRRGGQRHREKGRSLVDMAAQKQHDEQMRRQQPEQPRQETAAASQAVQFCTFCGGRVQCSYRFCQHCGAARETHP